MEHPQVIAFIGGGNMARSLIGGLLKRGIPASMIHVADPNPDIRAALSRDFLIRVFEDNLEAALDAQTWVLAVKPQAAREVCVALSAVAVRTGPLVVSIAAGISSDMLADWLGPDLCIARCMPNIPALIGAGITGIFVNDTTGPAERVRIRNIFASVGETVLIEDEQCMDAVTAVSGSGPAYIFLVAESMETAARSQGLPQAVARALVAQTLLGAARMLTESHESPSLLRQRVTSPGGTTEAAVSVLEGGGLPALFADAVGAATRRSRSLTIESENPEP